MKSFCAVSISIRSASAPTIEEARAFLDSKDPDKRAKLIDQLLERPERADLWAMRFSDMYRAGYNEAGQKGGGAYGRWFRDQIRKDVPYDEMVRNMLVSQGRHDFEGISNFYFVSREITPEESGINVSQLLLGLQIECARCHNHPFEKWKQDDFYGFAAFFARVEPEGHVPQQSQRYLSEGNRRGAASEDEEAGDAEVSGWRLRAGERRARMCGRSWRNG